MTDLPVPPDINNAQRPSCTLAPLSTLIAHKAPTQKHTQTYGTQYTHTHIQNTHRSHPHPSPALCLIWHAQPVDGVLMRMGEKTTRHPTIPKYPCEYVKDHCLFLLIPTIILCPRSRLCHHLPPSLRTVCARAAATRPRSTTCACAEFAERRCSDSGQWAPMAMGPSPDLTAAAASEFNSSSTSVGGDHHGGGWTNYTPCYTPELYDLFRRINETGNMETIFDIAERTRVLEFVGLGVSLVALLISLGIFCRFR